MRKLITKLHLWMAVPFGIIISIMCLTGAILVFETEIKQHTDRRTYFVENVGEQPIPLTELIMKVQEQLSDTVVISGVTISRKPDRNYRFSVAGGGRNTITADQYTGEVRGKIEPYAKGFFSTMRRLHRWFLFQMQRDGISWGKLITGTATLVFFFIIVSGLVIWVPKSVKSLRRRLKVGIGKGRFRFWFDLHVAGGFYTALFLIAFCLTGLTWSFNWYRTGFYKVFGVAATQQTGGGHGGSGRQGSNAAGEGRGRGITGGDTAHADSLDLSDLLGQDAEKVGITVDDSSENRPRGGRGAQRPERESNGREYRHGNDMPNEDRSNDYSGEGRGDREENTGRERGGRRPGESAGEDSGSRHENRSGSRDGGSSGRSGRGGQGADGAARLYPRHFRIWEDIAAELHARYGKYNTITVQDGSASVSLGNYGNIRAADRYTFDRESGLITDTQLYKDSERSAKIRGWIYSVHVGAWGGITTRILSFIACIVGAALPVTGYWFWLRKRRVKRKNAKKRASE